MIMQNRSISLRNAKESVFSSEKHKVLTVDDFLTAPEDAIDQASLQKFAKITPQYPGIRSPLPESMLAEWLQTLAPTLTAHFEPNVSDWQMQAWFSLVTASPSELIPLQRFPHVDGTDPRQLAMMLYLSEPPCGGTAFFRHIETGYSDLSDARFPKYREALQAQVGKIGLPPAQYVSDGAPFFERIYASSGAFNQAVFYRGNIFHSGMIGNATKLSADPRKGRLTINAFFRPK